MVALPSQNLARPIGSYFSICLFTEDKAYTKEEKEKNTSALRCSFLFPKKSFSFF